MVYNFRLKKTCYTVATGISNFIPCSKTIPKLFKSTFLKTTSRDYKNEKGVAKFVAKFVFSNIKASRKIKR